MKKPWEVFRDFIRDSLGSLKGRKPWFFFCPYVLFWEGSSGIPHGQKSVSSEINAGFLPPSSNGFILLDGGWWRWQGIIYCLNLHLFALASLVNKSLVSARRVPRNNRKVEVCASLSRLVAKRWESIWGLSSIRPVGFYTPRALERVGETQSGPFLSHQRQQWTFQEPALLLDSSLAQKLEMPRKQCAALVSRALLMSSNKVTAMAHLRASWKTSYRRITLSNENWSVK